MIDYSSWAPVPDLDIDRRLGKPDARGKLERRIVANLIAHLDRNGFVPYRTYDGEEFTLVGDVKSAMEVVFNLDEVSLRFIPKSWANARLHPITPTPEQLEEREWGVLLVLGNGVDIISDWNYSKADGDGAMFGRAMDAFDADDFT
ncbi:MAG: hypothetical protein ACXWHZ_03710 [Usitatibacter sp.]